MRLQEADQKWDSIRRIPYSAPGRWIQTLDMESLHCLSPEDAFRVDEVLNRLFPLVPSLTRLILNPRTTFSRRVFSAFTYRDGIHNIRVLNGFQVPSSPQADGDSFVELLRACTRLEELEIVGTGIDISDMSSELELPNEPPPTFHPLHLPFLRKLAALSMPSSPVLFALLHSPLPALRHLTLTPYDELSVPTTLIPRFLTAHGGDVTSLHLYTVKQWPTTRFPTPPTLLETCPRLRHASLELPLPRLALPRAAHHAHLEILSVPRPCADFWPALERLLPQLPRLRFVRARDVRWLRGGMSDRAQQAGVQGEMLLWRRRLTRRGVQLLDAEWKTGPEQ